MARRGWSASNFLRLASGIITAAPFTLSVWAKTSLTGAQVIAGLYNSASTANINCFKMLIGSTDVNFVVADGSLTTTVAATGSIVADTWFHACAVEASATDHRAFFNGGGKATSSTSRIPSGVNRFSVGKRDNVSSDQPWAPAGTGDLAEVGLWNIALSDADVLALSKGMSPLRVHPEALVGYWPLQGNNSPENNFKSNLNTLSVQGSLTKAAHPRILMPKHRLAR